MSGPALHIIAQGAWNGGTLLDNTHFEGRGLTFKNGVPVTGKTIEDRIGVRTRVAAPDDIRIGALAMEDLLKTSGIDPARVRLLVGATNVGEDKRDPGPLVRFPMALIQPRHPDLLALDLYAGCPGFNVAVELVFMLSICGVLAEGDLSVIVGAENIHRAKAFRPEDTANIIFGDDALATALATGPVQPPEGTYSLDRADRVLLDSDDFVGGMAEAILRLTQGRPIDGLIVDNHLGKIQYRVPAIAARVQHCLVERMFPQASTDGTFQSFKNALSFYDTHINAFAYDIMSMTTDAALVETLAGAYARSGKYRTVVSARVGPDLSLDVTLHRGRGFTFPRPSSGIVDTATRTHGCFGNFIQAATTADDVFGEMDGKGVFLYATRGAKEHLTGLLSANGLTLQDLDLVIEHQANFAMLPLTLEQLFADRGGDVKPAVADFLSQRMLTNVHERGNCSVVCMQRLPYDLDRGALKPDTIQGYAVNRNLDRLRSARTILYDSVGAGMTRSSFLQRLI